jgi:methylmalonyl-CoA mutase cobalamin-binding subunit
MNTELTKMEFRVYEIEHSEDLSDAISELQRYGAEKITVVSTDFDESESAKFEVFVPENKVKEFILDVRTQMCV